MKPIILKDHTPITESILYKISLETHLLSDMCNDTTDMKFPYNQQMVPEFPRMKDAGDKTRLLLTYWRNPQTDIPTTAIGFDEIRLKEVFNIDELVNNFHFGPKHVLAEPYDIPAIKTAVFNAFMGALMSIMDLTKSSPSGTDQDLDDVSSKIVGSLIAICFNDPLDIWMVMTQQVEEGQSEPTLYCHIKAVKPRPKN